MFENPLRMERKLAGLAVAAAAAALLAVPASAGVVVNDSFADGDQTKTGALDTNWWTSSSSSGDEISVGSLGLVTGTSGRGIHTVFPAQTLANAGDKLTATYTFTTPDTIGSNKSAAFRSGLFNSLGRPEVDAHISASSGSPNEAAYGRSVGNGGTGTPGLPGYMLDHDVNLPGVDDDLNFRKHNTGSATGRLMATTGSGSFSSFSSGPDADYGFLPNTEYTGSFMIERNAAGELILTGAIGGTTYSIVDDAPDTYTFDSLFFHVNSNTFGSSNSAGNPDNGIDFSNVTIEYVPEPGSLALLSLGGLALLRRRG